MDKTLLDLQDDESVHEGLKEALEYYNRKDADTILLDIFHLTFVDCKRLKEALKCFNSKDVGIIVQDFIHLLSVHCVYLKEALKGFNLKYKIRILLEFTHLIFVHCVHLKEALKGFNLKHLDEILLDFTNCMSACYEDHKEACKCFNSEDVRTIQLDLMIFIFVHFEHLKEALKCLNRKSKLPRLQAYSACARIFFIGIRAGTINNERVTLETMSGEWLDMPLNCRESQVLSTEPVHLQLKRPWDVADDDVGGVAVVKYEDREATCEGLILRYKPYVISRDEEPVEMQNAFSEVIPVRGCKKVLFDTGNEVATGISRELLLKLNLQPDPNKKKKVESIGEDSREFETVQIELVVRGHHFSVCGLVDAVAKDTNLLVGMDIIQQLYDRGYTIGN